MRISLCMIVRDEEGSLARCLASAAPCADEICVIDTGSSDDTRAIAQRAGARVLQFEWCDDFAAARNASLEMAGGDWILVLDADEEVSDPYAREKLEAFAHAHRPPSDKGAAAGQVTILNHSAEGQDDEISRVSVTRFFAHLPGARFEGRVHEQLVIPPARAAQLAPLERGDTQLEVHHYGYTRESLAKKRTLARNLRMLELALAERPGDPYLWYQLGRTQFVSGAHEAALQAFEQALSRCPDGAPYGGHLLESAGYSLRALGRSSHALAWLSQVEAEFQDRADTCFLVALLSMDVGDLARAEKGFRRCLELEGTTPAGGESAPGASSYAALYNLGVMREVLGDWDEALTWYRRALEVHPRHAPSLQGLGRLHAGRMLE